MKEYRQSRFVRPPGATEILLVRHGESRAARPEDPFPLRDGHGDPELSAVGRSQALAVKMRLASEPIGAIYVTSLRRTVETAAPLAEHLGIEPRVEADLREVHLGDWEGGKFRVMAAERDPTYVRMQQEERWDVIPGAESHDTLRFRVSAALQRLNEGHPDELIVAVVHGGIIGHILSEAVSSRPFAFNGADNGSISHVVLTKERVMVRRFNDIAHLAGVETDGAMT